MSSDAKKHKKGKREAHEKWKKVLNSKRICEEYKARRNQKGTRQNTIRDNSHTLSCTQYCAWALQVLHSILHCCIAPFCCLQADYSRNLGGRCARLQVAPQWEQSWHLWHQTALALPLRMEAAAVVAATTCSQIEWTIPLKSSCTRTEFRPLCLFDSCTLWPRWHEKPTLQI